ncbi:MAG: LysR family transcriptional regulator [Glaciimonas sp.]|nr:LysR family transcriptional regulator [Glaciimonas sp.]
MNRIALYHLETLLWIARLGTFSAAAERLNTTQPSVSARIRELESHVGVKLFQREGRRMMLTIRGRQLAQQCEPLWNDLKTMLLSPEEFSKASGIVRLGCGEIAAALWLPAFVAELKRSMPRVTLEIDIDLTINLRQKLEAGLLDIAFVVGPVDTPTLLASKVATIDMLWMTSSEPKASPAARRSRADQSQAKQAEQQVWCLSRPSHLYQVMVESLRNAGLNSRSINTCNHVRALIDIIASGAGIGIIPEPMARDRIGRGELVPVSPALTAAPIEFFVIMGRAIEEPVIQEIFKRAKKIASPKKKTIERPKKKAA